MMEIIYDLNDICREPTVATIGSFDGVHRGHVAMIEETRRRAAALALPVTLVTFSRHPRMLFDTAAQPFLLSTQSGRMERLAATGVERCVVLDFDKELASMTAREFMHKVLAEHLNVKLLVLGYDHRFGRPVEGENSDSYIEYGRECGIEVVRAAKYDEAGYKISSSQVRRALAAGETRYASQCGIRRKKLHWHLWRL